MATSRTTKNSNTTKMTPFEKECIEVIKQVNEYKLIAEANAISTIYKNPDLIRNVNLNLEDLNNNSWKVYFSIANDIINVEKKNTLDEITVNMYLSKHPKLCNKYEEYGGYDTIASAIEYIKEENFESYVSEIKKWNVIIKLARLGFPVKDRLSEFVDLKVEDIYNEFEALLNHTFVNVDTEVKSYNGFEGMEELIERLDKGEGVGIPFDNCEYLTRETGGMLPGEIIGLGASTGTGKSTLSINYIFPSMVKYNLKAVFIINEENQDKFKQEAIIWYLNNIKKTGIQKHVLRNGHFTPEVKKELLEAAKWFEEQKDNKNITIIPLESYTSSMCCKLLKKYISLDADVICIDTLKESSDSRGVDTWKSLMRDTVDFYDIIKKSKTSLIITYQLTKNKSRYLTVADINASKGIVDVFSVNLFFRRPLQDEYAGEKRELKCTKIQGRSRIPFKLKDDGSHYMICFIQKNRHGQSDIQIVSKADFSTNEFSDLGYCVVLQDF